MRDLNFFEPYIEKREYKFDKMLVLYILFIIVFVYVAFSGIYNALQINNLRSQIVDKKAIAEEPKVVKKVNEIIALENEVNTFKEEVEKIVTLDKQIEASDVIGEDLINQIENKMPADLFMKNFSVNNNEIQISGVAKDRYTIAEFAKGLEEIENADSVFISNIVSEDINYSFNLNLTLKDVIEDGEQAKKEE